MPNPGRNPNTGVSIPKTKFGVYISANGQTKPTESDEDSSVYVEHIQQLAGSGLMEAVLISDLSKQNRHLQNLSLTKHSSRQVEIWTLNPSDGSRSTCLFWGEIVKQRLVIRKGEESQLLIAKLLPDHFDNLVDDMWVVTGDRDDLTGLSAVVRQELDLEFNPVVNQIRVPNMFSAEGDEPYEMRVWADTESFRTPEAEEHGGGTRDEWTLPHIVFTLSRLADNGLGYIELMTEDYINSKITDPPEVTDLTLRRGQYLPALLDQVLQPYGYGWFVKFSKDDGGASLVTPEIYQRGLGDEKTVDLQAVGEDYERVLSNLEQSIMEVDIGSLHNVVEGYGALKQYEVTVELYRSWKPTQDGSYDHADPNNPIGRKLVGNEGADYQTVRPEIDVPEFPVPWIIKRRVMDDCLTTRDGERLPPFLEFSLDDGDTWEDAPQGWAFRPLRNEIGVYFTAYDKDGDQAIPAEVLDTDVRFRITCTITMDSRDEQEKDATSDSPRQNESKMLVDLSNRFQFQERSPSFNETGSELSGDISEIDDSLDLEEFVDKIGVNEQAARIMAELPLHGILSGYAIGDLITEIKGRNISMNRNSLGAAEKRYLQIVGVRYDNRQDQRTILTVAPYDL